MMQARIVEQTDTYNMDFAASQADAIAAIKWALEERGYAIATEDARGGVITTTWQAIKSDSHYMPFFSRPDYGVTDSYYQLELRAEPLGGRTNVYVTARAKSLLSNLKSSGFEERKVLDGIGNYLRKGEPAVSNLGLEE